MARMSSLIALATAAALAAGCNVSLNAKTLQAGETVDRDYRVGTFDRIESAGPYEVVVTSSGQPGVRARGGANFLDNTEISVVDGVLRIRPKKRNMTWSAGNADSKVRIAVTAAALRGATLAGSGNIRIDRVGGDFAGTVAGSGDLAVDRVDAGRFAVEVAGSGTVRAAGRARSTNVSIAGSGDVDLSGLETAAANVSIAGSGNVRARATGTATVAIMGSGNVDISGGARCDVSRHGSGRVRCS